MAAPNMATITASLEQSLQNCSLNHHRSSGSSVSVPETSFSPTSTSNNPHLPISDTSLELNSHVSLPFHWEQCLDLKTGEIYYINWRNGMRAREDPRITGENSGEYYSEEESCYDSEESSSESSPSSTINSHGNGGRSDQVLVVAGCKSCFMYFMVPKQVQQCVKCGGQLLHFDSSDNGFP